MDVLVLMQVKSNEVKVNCLSIRLNIIIDYCSSVSVAQEPVLPGSFLRARAIGLMPMIDQVNDFFLL